MLKGVALNKCMFPFIFYSLYSFNFWNWKLFFLPSTQKHSINGDIFGLLSAVCYGLFTGTNNQLKWILFHDDNICLSSNFDLNIIDQLIAVLLKNSAGSGDMVDMENIFGCIGIYSFLGFWWL